MLSYEMVRPLIFQLEPEKAHDLTLAMLRLAGAVAPANWLLRSLYQSTQPAPPVHAFGLTFPNRVGLAAGYDKDGLAWRGLAALGFGHIEIGTVTFRPQAGNPGPRIFRLPGDRALINRMGFPSRGSAFVAERLAGPRPAHLVLGVNIGKNKATPLAEAGEDYVQLLRIFAPLADYLTINVSSPNTPDLRNLQARRALEALLLPLALERRHQVQALGKRLPLLVKLAPDLTSDALDGALEAIVRTGMNGVVLSNTTVGRSGLTSPLAPEAGGLSGEPLRAASTELVRAVARRTYHRLPIVACGGIMRPEDARQKLDAGATLVQLFSGLVYAGPSLVGTAVEATASAATPLWRPRIPAPQDALLGVAVNAARKHALRGVETG